MTRTGSPLLAQFAEPARAGRGDPLGRAAEDAPARAAEDAPARAAETPPAGRCLLAPFAEPARDAEMPPDPAVCPPARGGDTATALRRHRARNPADRHRIVTKRAYAPLSQTYKSDPGI